MIEPKAGLASLSRRSRARALAVALLACFALLALRSAWVHSGVPDEVAVHAPGGYLYATSGRFAGGLGNPPLGMLWIAAPAALLPIDYEPFGERGLLAFRLPVIALALAGGCVLTLLARSLFGAPAALAALFFFAFSPTLLAHASLATLDVPIAVAVVAAVACARRTARLGRTRDFALLGLAVGTACAIKVQGLAVAPLVVAQLALAPDRAWRGEGPRQWNLASGALIALVLAGLVVHLAYGTLPGIGAGVLPASFLDATARKLSHGAEGHFAYLLGDYSMRGWWSYFPIIFAVKTPLPLLVCAAVGIAATVSARSRDALVWIVLPVGLFFAAAVAGSVNIGIRHLLPVHPFLMVLGGVGLVFVAKRSRSAAGVLAAVYAGGTLWASPHHLTYFNALGGGARNGYRVAVDSNYDWGQHDGPLRDHLAALSDEERSRVVIDPDPLVPRSGRILVGASALHGILGPGPGAYAWLREREPDARIADTWFEYRVEAGEAPADPVDARSAPGRVALAGHVLRTVRDAARLEAAPRHARSAAAACFAVLEYRCALEAVAAALRADPGDRSAFWTGSELVARWRLGVLRFTGTEYLVGFDAPLPAANYLEPAELARRVRGSAAARPLHALHETLADSYWVRSRWSDALAQLELAEASLSGDFATGYKLGWLLSTIPDDGLRDGERARGFARSHGERSAWRTAASFDLLAAAHAERGKWPEAVAAAERALGASRDSAEQAAIRARLDGYRARRAHRLPRG